MRRKIITLVLALTLVFSMSVPSFAGAVTGPSYFAVGDSIAAGCINVDPETELYHNPGFADLHRFSKNDIRNSNVYQVPRSFVYKVAKEINANKLTSYNGSYIGLQLEDLADILGVSAYKDDNYPENEGRYDWITAYLFDDLDWTNETTEELFADAPTKFSKLFNDANKAGYKKAIKRADVITIELGINDFSNHAGMMFNLTNVVQDSISPVMEDASFISSFIADLQGAMNGDRDSMVALSKDFGKMIKLGIDVTKLIKDIEDAIKATYAAEAHYFDGIMNYIKNHNPNAIVVVATLPNPMKDIENLVEPYKEYIEGSTNFEGLSSAIALISGIAGKMVPPFNKYIKNNAVGYAFGQKIRNYYVADISATSINPPMETWKYFGKDKDGKYGIQNFDVYYMLHPNAYGQQVIADAFLEQIYKAKAERGSLVAKAKATKTTKKVKVEKTLDKATQASKVIKGLPNLGPALQQILGLFGNL
ncbi:MAG: hypothetical protein MJ146_03440 [Clostridia bacterium]|nr:hypothetical protein [Clostridia bacterium]